jgi:hypothetical protein
MDQAAITNVKFEIPKAVFMGGWSYLGPMTQNQSNSYWPLLPSAGPVPSAKLEAVVKNIL